MFGSGFVIMFIPNYPNGSLPPEDLFWVTDETGIQMVTESGTDYVFVTE